MARTHEKVRYPPESKRPAYTAGSAAEGIEQALKMLEGRWKLLILFHLFGGKVLRFSELERAIPAISQKMLIQQLRQMEADGMVRRIVHHQVPPKVEYGLTDNLSLRAQYLHGFPVTGNNPKDQVTLGAQFHF